MKMPFKTPERIREDQDAARDRAALERLIGTMNAYGCMDRSGHTEADETMKDLLRQGAAALEKLTADLRRIAEGTDQ